MNEAPIVISDTRVLSQIYALSRHFSVPVSWLINRVLLDWIATQILDTPGLTEQVPELKEHWDV